MPGITRKDIDTAGGVLLQGSSNVFVNGRSMVRIGDAVQGHSPGVHSNPVMVQGSSSVFCNRTPVCRAGHQASCGHPATGSVNVFIGGS